MKKKQNTLTALILGTAISFTAPLVLADEKPATDKKESAKKEETASSQKTVEKTPYTAKDRAWITLEGKVTSASPDSFVLDYGKGAITVEMDDYDWYQEGYSIFQKDRVTVHGQVDADPNQLRTIEASSVWVENLGTYFFANSADEEDFLVYYVETYPNTSKMGTVTKIDGNEFMLEVEGEDPIQIDVDTLGENPLDDEGFIQVDEGDRVWVTGDFDKGYLEKDEIHAKTLTVLSK